MDSAGRRRRIDFANWRAAPLQYGRANPLVLSFVVGTALCLYLIGYSVFSGFSTLDDHDIIAWMGHGLWSRIGSTELGYYGVGIRFRPVMYMLVIGESFLFGTNPHPYHVLQLVRFSVFLSAFAWAGFRTIGIVAGLLLLLMVGNEHYWGNIWTHSLFVSEQTACLGIGLLIFGYGLFASWFVAGRPGRLDRAILLASIGSLVCVGSKENFLPMIPLNIAVLVFAWRQTAITKGTLAISLFLIAAQLAICYGIIAPNMGQMKTDSDLGMATRLMDIFHTKRFALRIYLAWAGGIAAAALAIRGQHNRPREKTRELFVLSALLLWSGIYLCWEQFFYHGLLPTGFRYDFPAYLIDPILVAAAFYALVQARERFGWFGNQVSPAVLRIFLAQAVLAIVLWPATRFLFDRERLFPVHFAVKRTGEHSAAMVRDMERVRRLTAQHPDWPIILRTGIPEEYEGVLTFPIWLRYYKVSNPASVESVIRASDIHLPTEEAMTEGIRNASAMGLAGLYVARDAAIIRAEEQGHCYISQAQDAYTRCIRLPFRQGDYNPVEE